MFLVLSVCWSYHQPADVFEYYVSASERKLWVVVLKTPHTHLGTGEMAGSVVRALAAPPGPECSSQQPSQIVAACKSNCKK